MADKVKLNKNTLREQKQQLALFLEFLPTLELRKQQLQTELRKLDTQIDEQERALRDLHAEAEVWSPMLTRILPWVKPLVVIEAVEVHQGNVAGVRVPIFDEVRFTRVPYSLVGTAPVIDAAIAHFHEAISAREALRVTRQQRQRLQQELVKTTQRINLYEKLMIPETKENIRKIKVYLGDQQTAAVCRAKIAKAKIVAKAAEAEA